MPETTEQQQRFAVLIDGDNAQASLLPKILAEVSEYGLITIKRLYGDWTTPSMNSWKTALHKNAIQPVQQFRNTVGKNATDSAMIIDAMDILHSKHVDAFCIVSSDSDYTRLATRIREEAFFVIGVGEKKTPEAFVNACNQFIFSENLVPPPAPRRRQQQRRPAPEAAPAPAPMPQPEAPEAPTGETSALPYDPLPLLLQGFGLAAKDQDWVHLSSLGNILRRLDPAFDPRNYGHQQLQKLIAQYPDVFTFKQDDSKKPPILYVALAGQQDKAEE